MLSNVSRNTVDFAKSNLEWMSDIISKNFITTRENAFALEYAQDEIKYHRQK